jgi:hypothetical protein
MMTSRPDYQGFTFDGLAGAIPLEKDMPIPLPVSKRSAGQQESTKESAEAERVPQSMVYYKNKRSGTLTCDGETFDFVLSRKEAAMLSLLMEQPGVPWEASGLQSKAKEVGIIQFWNSVRSLGGKLEPETSSFMSAVRIVYGETLDTSIITLLMDSIEVRTGRQAPQIFTAPWFENPPVFPTEKQKSEPDAAKHKGIIDIVPEPVRAKRLGELTDPQKSSVDRFTAVLSEAAMRGEPYVTLAEIRREMFGQPLRTRMTHEETMSILLTARQARGIEGKQTGRHVLAKYTPSDRLLGYYFGIPGEAAPAPDKPLPPALPAERKTDQEPSLPIEVQPFEFVSEQAHGQQIRVTIRNRGTGTQYILTDSTAYLFLNLRVGSANITTPEELEEALAVHLTDKQDIGTRVRKAQANSAHNDFPYQIQVKKSSNYREIIGYYLEQESNETEIEIGQARSVVPERDKSINYSTKSGFTTHELSTLAWSLLADPTIRQTFLKTRTPFFPSEEMLQAIIAENGFPTSEPPSAEAIGAILEKAQDKIAELYYDTKLYDQLQFRKKDDMWALMVGLVMVDRMTFKSNAGTISGLLYIAEAYQEPEQAALREIIPADRYRERTVFTQNQVLEKLDRIFAKQRIVFDEARNTTEDAETFDLDDL